MAGALRALVLLALLAVPAGCLGGGEEGPRLAQPTSAPNPHFPTPTTARPNQPTPNLFNTSDPGYVMTEEWTVGDAWYWESNRTPVRFRSMQVLEKRLSPEGHVFYLLEETQGFVLNPPQGRPRVVVNGTDWTRLKADDAQTGTSIVWSPPAEGLRATSNKTYSFNESGRGAAGITWNEGHSVRSYFAAFEKLTLPWGEQRQVARIEHRDLVTDLASGTTRRDLTIHWMDRKFLNDVLTAFDGNRDGDVGDDEDVWFALIGARVDGTTYGRLVQP